MNFIIEPKALKKFGLTIKDFGLILFCLEEGVPKYIEKYYSRTKFLWAASYIYKDRRGFKIDRTKLFRIIEYMKEYSEAMNKRAVLLAPKLIEIFPKGKKTDNIYFRSNRLEVTNKLKKFFSYFGDEYSDEDIIEATKNYVNSFNGNYSYMRVLKYFIWKNVVKAGEDSSRIEEISDLATWLENKGNEDSLREDWMSTMV